MKGFARIVLISALLTSCYEASFEEVRDFELGYEVFDFTLGGWVICFCEGRVVLTRQGNMLDYAIDFIQ